MDSKAKSESLDKFVSIIGDISQRILETNEPARIKKISALRSCSTDDGEVCIKTFFEVTSDSRKRLPNINCHCDFIVISSTNIYVILNFLMSFKIPYTRGLFIKFY